MFKHWLNYWCHVTMGSTIPQLSSIGGPGFNVIFQVEDPRRPLLDAAAGRCWTPGRGGSWGNSLVWKWIGHDSLGQQVLNHFTCSTTKILVILNMRNRIKMDQVSNEACWELHVRWLVMVCKTGYTWVITTSCVFGDPKVLESQDLANSNLLDLSSTQKHRSPVIVLTFAEPGLHCSVQSPEYCPDRTHENVFRKDVERCPKVQWVSLTPIKALFRILP